MNPPKKRILMIQPSLQPPGGGNNVAAWTIEALKREHSLTVLTWTPINLAEMNRYFGTSLQASDFDAMLPSPVLRRLLDVMPVPLSLLKMHILLRFAKRVQRDFDLLMTINNEADFGSAGIQYVNFPALQRPRPETDLRWYHRWRLLLRAYYLGCERISDFSTHRLKSNLTLVNSSWTSRRFRECHGVDGTVLYPPVPGEFPEVPWDEREDGFVSIARYSPEKEIDKVIDIIAGLRARGFGTHLHLIGGRDPGFKRYHRHIRRRAAQNASWVFLHEDIARADLVALIARHRYGIHGMSEEHFGIAVAEMIRAGCIVFVPRGGGQVEIVGNEERLLYNTAEDAVEKIVVTLHDGSRQFTLRQALQKQAALFSTERFMLEMRQIVRAFEHRLHDPGVARSRA